MTLIAHEAEIILLRALVVASVATHPNKEELTALFRAILSDIWEPPANKPQDELTVEIRARSVRYLQVLEAGPGKMPQGAPPAF